MEDNYKTKVFIALDESGKLNANDVCTHFVIGGFLYSEKKTVKSAIRKVEARVKQKNRIDENVELKGSGFHESVIVDYVNGVFDILDRKIIPIFSVVSKKDLDKNFTMRESLAYNFLVDNLFHFYSKKLKFTRYVSEISILMDQRNLKKTEENDLSSLLRTIYIEKPYEILTYQMSSKNTDVIRFSDVLDHVVYQIYNHPNGEKAEYFKKNINEKYLHRIKKGIIFYPFKKSYFEELERMHNFKIKTREDAKKVIDKLKEHAVNKG